MIETKRLFLRPWQAEDIDIFAEINSDPRVADFMFPRPPTLDESRSLANRFIERFKQYGFGQYPVVLKETGKVIGFTGLNVPTFEAHFTPCVEIGWRMSPTYWNFGYTTEAAKAVLDHAFQILKLKEIVSFTTPRNIASQRVMQKIGMHHDPKGDFNHPNLPPDHPLTPHILFRISSYLN